MAHEEPLPPTGPENLTGKSVGRFQILGLLGAGGMGEVYRGEDTVLRRPVALKRVSYKLRADSRARRHILKEAQRACSLNSPHIAGVYDVLEEHGEIFLVMEYVEGETLRQRVRSRGPMPLADFLGIARQCAEALTAAHQKGVIHRDIKPDNIMINSAGQVKILDFGLARQIPRAEEGAPTASLESGGNFAGTPAYMAPEALLEEEVDERADIFSLGVTFYEVVSGRHPFGSHTGVATVGRVLHEVAPPLSTLVASAPAELERILSKMLAKDPAERYATAADLLVDLRALERGQPRPALTPVPRPRARRYTRWTLLGVAASLVLLALLASLSSVREEWRHWLGILPAEKDIAVLPFEAISNDPGARAFAQGLGETLTVKLAQLTDKYPLQVVPPSEFLNRSIRSVQQARIELGVNLVLEGSVQQSGKLVRVTYSLVDARSGQQLRAGIVTADAADPFAVEDRVVESAVSALDLELGGEQRRALEAHGTAPPKVYDLYLRGRGYLMDYQEPKNIESAILAFESALKLDPNYAPVNAGLGEAYWFKYESTHAREWVAKAEQACQRAVAEGGGHACLGQVYNGTGRYEKAATEYQQALGMDPTSDDAYRGMGYAYEQLGRMREAEETYRRAIRVRPHYWAGYSWLGVFLWEQARLKAAAEAFQHVMALAPDNVRGCSNLGGIYIVMGRYSEAIPVLKRCLAIQPSSDIYSNLGLAYFDSRHYDQAVHNYEQAVKLNPSSHTPWGNLAEAYYWMPGLRGKAAGAYRKAIALAENAEKVNPHDARVLGQLAVYHAMLGERKPAQGYIKQALALAPDNAELRFKSAIVEQQSGQRERALQWLGKALAVGLSPSEIRNNPVFDNLEKEQRFRKLLESGQSTKRRN